MNRVSPSEMRKLKNLRNGLARALRRFGMSREQYFQLLDLQNDVCAICGHPPKGKTRLSIDHCHKTEMIRGLLCDPCNMAIGALQDDPYLCFKAAEYLIANA